MYSPETSKHGRWTKRFILAAIIQGAVICGLTLFLVLGQMSFTKPEVSRVVAAGGAGTWFTFGYIMYILVGVVGVAVSALFYYYIEVVLVKPFRGNIGIFPWIHLSLMNIGTSATMGLLMYAGYLGGASMLPTSVGGQGFDATMAHEILAPFIEPIASAILVLILGLIVGGIGFLLNYRSVTRARSELGIDLGESDLI